MTVSTLFANGMYQQNENSAVVTDKKRIMKIIKIPQR